MPQISGRAALAIGGSLALALSAAPGAVSALSDEPAAPAAAPDAAEDCALPGAGAGLHSGIPTPDGFAPTRGTVSALTLFIDFPDAEAEVSTRERFAEFFPGTAEHFAASSYGRLEYRTTPLHSWLRMPRTFEEYGIDRGVGWHPGDPDGYNRLMRDIVIAAEAAAGELAAETAAGTAGDGDRDEAGPGPGPGPGPGEFAFGSHDLVNILVAPNAGPSALETVLSVSFPGRPLISTASGRLENISFIWSSQPGESPYRVLVHENGHAFGLPDLYWTGPGTAPELTGHWDVMEQDWGPSNDIMAWHKWKLEWLDDAQVDCVSGPGVTEHLLTPLGAPPARPVPEAPSGPSDISGPSGPSGDTTGTPGPAPAGTAPAGPAPDTRLVAIPTGPRKAITLEVRTPTELDQAVCRSGVLVTRVDTGARSGEGPMRVVDATPGSGGCLDSPDPQVTPGLTDAAHIPGEAFRDEDQRVEVEVLEADGDDVHRVRVTRW